MKYIQNPKINQRLMADEVMLVLPREIKEKDSPLKNDDTLLFLEKTGYEIWRTLHEGKTLLEILQYMQGIYDVEENILKTDIENFIKKSIELGIIIEIR